MEGITSQGGKAFIDYDLALIYQNLLKKGGVDSQGKLIDDNASRLYKVFNRLLSLYEVTVEFDEPSSNKIKGVFVKPKKVDNGENLVKAIKDILKL